MSFDPIANGATTVAAKPAGTVAPYSSPAPLGKFDPVAQGAVPISQSSDTTQFDPVQEGATPASSDNLNVQSVATAAVGAMKNSWDDGTKQTIDYVPAVANAIHDSFTKALSDTADKVSSAFTDWGQGGKSGNISRIGEAGLGVVNTLLSPITGTFKGLESVPVLGFVAKGVNSLFAGIGGGASNLGLQALNQLNLSQSTKDELAPVVRDTSALAGQIIAGNFTDDTVSNFHTGIQSILSKVKDGVDIATPLAADMKGTAAPTDVSQETSVKPADVKTGEVQPAVTTEPKPTENVPAVSPVEPKTALSTIPSTEVVKPSETSVEPIKTDTTPAVKTGANTVDVRTAKSASDISQTMAEKGFESLPEEEKAKYSVSEKADVLQKVSDIMKNEDDARARIRGDVATESHIRQPLWNAMEKFAMEKIAKGEDDGGMINELAKSPIASKRSLAAQELGSAGFNQNEHSPVEAVREITKQREDEYQKRTGQSVEKAKKASVTKDRVSLTDELKKATSKRPTWEEFVQKISCQV